MITLLKVTDINQIHSLLSKDDLYKNILACDNLATWAPSPAEAVILGLENGKPFGVAVLQETSDGYVIFHAGIYKEFRHKKTLSYLKKTIKKLKRVVYPLHIITTIPEQNIAAVMLFIKLGFKYKKTTVLKGINYRVFSE